MLSSSGFAVKDMRSRSFCKIIQKKTWNSFFAVSILASHVSVWIRTLPLGMLLWGPLCPRLCMTPLCRIAPSVRVDSDRLGSTWCGIVSIFATVGRLGPVTPSPLGLVGPLARQIRLSWIISLRCRKPCGVFATGRSVDAQLRTLRADSNSRATAPTTPYIGAVHH